MADQPLAGKLSFINMEIKELQQHAKNIRINIVKMLNAAGSGHTGGPLGITDVAQMAQAHVSDAVIISQIRATGSVFRLSSTDTIWLKQNGVSDAVIQEMVISANRAPRYYSAQPVYVVEPPPPPVSVGVGIGFRR